MAATQGVERWEGGAGCRCGQLRSGLCAGGRAHLQLQVTIILRQAAETNALMYASFGDVGSSERASCLGHFIVSSSE